MTKIIIDGVENPQDLYDALAKVTHVFRNPLKFASPEEKFLKRGYHTEPAEVPAEKPAPEPPLTPYVACPDRGSHLRLTDCWICYSDVHRGACLEVDAVSPEGWDVAMVRLSAVPDFPPVIEDTHPADDDALDSWLTLPFAEISADEDDQAA